MGRIATKDRAEPPCRLVRFDAADGVELAGLLYEPRRPTQRAFVFVHGNGGASIFDSKRTNILASEFLAQRSAYFAFNNRGAHLLRRLKRGRKSVQGGMAHERIRGCVPDFDGAARELRRRGYRDLTLIGHSTGANKVAVYDHYKPRNPFKRYVLLAGGDDTGILYDQLGPRRFRNALEKARTMIKARRGAELVPPSVSPQPLSWTSFYDMANPDGDYNVFPFVETFRDVRLSRRAPFRYVKAIRKPALVLYGDADQYAFGDVSRCVRILADAIGPKPNIELGIIEDADHGFGGREEELARVIGNWMT
jgi:pimeloyl-ACP methyl ester carboxylesterase